MTLYEKAQMHTFNAKLQEFGELIAGVAVKTFIELDAGQGDYDELIVELNTIKRKLPEMIELSKEARRIAGGAK